MQSVSMLELVLLVVLGVGAGWLGAVVGIGGGVIVVPALVLGFGADIRVAVAASLVSVVATSTAAGSAYVGEGLTNMRLGMSLEIATTVGGISGGLFAVFVSPSVLAGVFAVMIGVTAFMMLRHVGSEEAPGRAHRRTAPDVPAPAGRASGREGWESVGHLGGAYYDAQQGTLVEYRAERLPLGSAVALVAGMASGMLGVGGGFLKVPAMNLGMRVPIKVAAATSNFMIGVTAISSLFVYFARGYLHPYVAAPLALGVVVGAFAGTRTSDRVSPSALGKVLAAVLVLVALEMALKAFGVSVGR